MFFHPRVRAFILNTAQEVTEIFGQRQLTSGDRQKFPFLSLEITVYHIKLSKNEARRGNYFSNIADAERLKVSLFWLTSVRVNTALHQRRDCSIRLCVMGTFKWHDTPFPSELFLMCSCSLNFLIPLLWSTLAPFPAVQVLAEYP